jgi:hypothetical protein
MKNILLINYIFKNRGKSFYKLIINYITYKYESNLGSYLNIIAYYYPININKYMNIFNLLKLIYDKLIEMRRLIISIRLIVSLSLCDPSTFDIYTFILLFDSLSCIYDIYIMYVNPQFIYRYPKIHLYLGTIFNIFFMFSIFINIYIVFMNSMPRFPNNGNNGQGSNNNGRNGGPGNNQPNSFHNNFLKTEKKKKEILKLNIIVY